MWPGTNWSTDWYCSAPRGLGITDLKDCQALQRTKMHHKIVLSKNLKFKQTKEYRKLILVSFNSLTLYEKLCMRVKQDMLKIFYYFIVRPTKEKIHPEFCHFIHPFTINSLFFMHAWIFYPSPNFSVHPSILSFLPSIYPSIISLIHSFIQPTVILSFHPFILSYLPFIFLP